MIFGKKKEKEILQKLENQKSNQSYWAIVKRQFRKNRIAVWSLRFLFVIFLIALFGDFIANEKPIYCKIEGKTYFPIFKHCLLYTSPSPRDATLSRMPSSA